MDDLAAHNRILEVCHREEGFVNYICVPTLENIAAVAIAVQLWRHSDLSDELQQHMQTFGSNANSYSSPGAQSFDRMEKEMSERLSSLSLPHRLRNKISDILRPVGFELLNCFEEHHEYGDLESIDAICWTMEGTVDKVKTLEALISNGNIEDNFCIACEHCAENHIANLWNQMPKIMQANVIGNKNNSYLVQYWKRICRYELPNVSCTDEVLAITDSMSTMLWSSIRMGNMLAMKYFWHKFTSNRKSKIIEYSTMRAINMCKYLRVGRSNNEHTGILCFLLSRLSVRKQQRVFQEYGNVILLALFLCWPWQKFLLPTIQTICGYLHAEVYSNMMSGIVPEVKGGNIADTLFRELWRGSPSAFKNEFIQHIEDGHLGIDVWKLLEASETVRPILNYTGVEERKRIMFQAAKYSSKVSRLLIANRHVLDALIADTLSLESDIGNLKKYIILKNGFSLCHDWITKGNWQEVEKFLNWGFTDQRQIDRFKIWAIDIRELATSLIRLGKYKTLDELMNWCFCSERIIYKFKKRFAYGYCDKTNMLRYVLQNWCSFEKFITWSFNSEESIIKFKLYFSQYEKMSTVVGVILRDGCNFEFSNKLLNWCYDSEEDINQFRRKFRDSARWNSIAPLRIEGLQS